MHAPWPGSSSKAGKSSLLSVVVPHREFHSSLSIRRATYWQKQAIGGEFIM